MGHPILATQELWQKRNPKIFFYLKIGILTQVLWTSEPSHLFGLLLNVWQKDTMHQSLTFSVMETKFAILTNKNIQEEKAVLIFWIKLHHQQPFEPGKTPALVPLSGHLPLLHRASEGCTGAHSAQVWATGTPWWAAAPTHPAAGSGIAWE